MERASDPVVVRASAKAARTWSRESDAPDVLLFDDVIASPNEAGTVVSNRIRSQEIGVVTVTPFPKPMGDVRPMTAADPYTVIWARDCLTPAISRIEVELERYDVFNTRSLFDASYRTWSTQPWRRQRSHFNKAVSRLRGEADVAAELSLDVAEHYSTIRLESLESTLHSSMIPAYTVKKIASLLRLFAEAAGKDRGIPTGIEFSGPLGTISLVPVDRALRGNGLRSVRWSDDFTIGLKGRGQIEAAFDVVDDQLKLGGQRLNSNKAQVADLDEETGMPIGSMDDGDADELDADRAVETLAWQAAFGVNLKIPNLLGRIRSAADTTALSILLRHPWIIERHPRQAGEYVRKVLTSDDYRFEAFLEYCVASTTTETVFAQLHMARSLPLIPASYGRRMISKALDQPSLAAPLRDQLLACGHLTDRPSQRLRHTAIDIAEAEASLNSQRACLSVFRSGGVDQKARRGLNHLAKSSPDLAPTCAWAA